MQVIWQHDHGIGNKRLLLSGGGECGAQIGNIRCQQLTAAFKQGEVKHVYA